MRIASLPLPFVQRVLFALLAVPAAWAAPPADAAPASPEATAVDEAALDALIEQARSDWRVPGLAIAIVKGDRVVYLKGFGRRDVARDLPVTPDTLFVGASTTKAFTATTAGLLVDRGELAWDAPVRTWLPGFAIADRDASAQISLRDMLSHRTGLPRHDLLWYNNDALRRDDLPARMASLQSSAPLRTRWQYNNLMYMLSGHVIETVAGKPWEQFARDELLCPLGMTRTNFSVREMAADRNAALAYKLDRQRVAQPIPLRPVDFIGPAGSINSTARDYAQWLRLNLDGGEVGGRRLLSAASLQALHAPLLPTGGKPEFAEFGTGFYGMGWFVDSYRGMTRVQHGGNLDGFAARVTLFPEQGWGSAIFVNLEGSPLPGWLSLDVMDRLVGLAPLDWSKKMLQRRALSEGAEDRARERQGELRVANAPPAHPLAQYAGTYRHPGYGTLAVTAGESGLRGVYNRMPFALAPWHYEVFNSTPDKPEDDGLEDLKFQFQTDARGQIAGVSVQMEALVEPILFERQVDARLRDPVFLGAFVGRYRYLDQRIEVALSGDRLVLTVPGQSPYTLLPQVDGNFVFENVRSIGVRFVREGQRVTGLQLLQPAGVFDAPREP